MTKKTYFVINRHLTPLFLTRRHLPPFTNCHEFGSSLGGGYPPGLQAVVEAVFPPSCSTGGYPPPRPSGSGGGWPPGLPLAVVATPAVRQWWFTPGRQQWYLLRAGQ